MIRLFFISLCLSIAYISQAQENYQQYMAFSYAEIDSLMMIEYQKGTYPKAILFMQAGREKAKVEFGELDSVFANYTNNLAALYYKMGNYEQALPLYIKSKNINEKVLGKDHPSFATPLNNLAGLYYIMGDYEQALSLYIQAKNIYEKALGKNHPKLASPLNNLAFIHKAMGNLELALPLYIQAIEIREKALGSDHPNLIKPLNNLALLYSDLNDFRSALSLYNKAINICKKALGEHHPKLAQTLNNLAALYQKKGDYERALPLYIQAKNIHEKALGKEHAKYANSLNNLATVYAKMDDYDLALPLLIQSTVIREKALGKEHPKFARSLNNLAKLHCDMGDYVAARDFLAQGMNAMSKLQLTITFEQEWINRLKDGTYTSNLHIEQMIRALNIAYELVEKDSTIQHATKKQENISDLAFWFLQKQRNQTSIDKDKLRLLEENSNWLDKSLTILDPEKNKIKAFTLADQNKSVLLLQATKSEATYRLGELPDSLVRQNKKLLKKQSQLQAKFYEKRPKTEKDSLRAVLNEVNQKLEDWQRIVKTQYPKYHQLKYEQVNAQAKDIQALLDAKTALIEYVLTDATLHIFRIDQKEVTWQQEAVSEAVLKVKVERLHQSLSNYQKLEENFKNYTELAHWFYQKLLRPVLKEGNRIEHLIIVTDGELGHLPFESFLVEATSTDENYKNLHYLLKDYNISYNYSATLWKENKEVEKRKNNGRILAMAANYSTKLDPAVLRSRLPTTRNLRDALSPLPAARKEAEALQARFAGYFAFDSLATERNLREKAGDYAIIHLAMHGLLEEKRPMLSSLALTEDGDSLHDNFWQAHEISKAELNADLVVLSACETGYGRFETGNGIASLARAFMYAGVPSLVVSLWQVNDQSTSQIMQNFYENLAKGVNKAEALRMAKLSYIESVESPIAAHPAFWSPFILIGDESPVQLQRKGGTPWGWIAGGGAGLLGLLGLVGLSRRKRAA